MRNRTPIFAFFGLLITFSTLRAHAAADQNLELRLSPKICTLAIGAKQCETPVHAQWRAPAPESLCLIIVGRPEIKHCWDHYAQGTYSIDLVFNEDVIFQLRDLSLEHVLTSATVRVIKEALRLRHRRRDPWNVFN